MAIEGEWANALQEEFSKPYYKELYQTVMREYRQETVYPPGKDVYNAFTYTPLNEVKVVILGQDPYHEEGQANGLCFSVHKGIRIPPSLANIYKEMNTDLGYEIPSHGDLSKWAGQGVLLLNTVLTVRAHAANSHRDIGWQQFTDAAIQAVAQQDRPIVFILWGAQARKKKSMIHNPKHLIIESPHPSPLSAFNGFFGSRPFSRCNDYLLSQGIEPIDWKIE